MKPSESDIEKRLRLGVKKLGGLCLKWVSPGFTGVPDRIILLPGGRVVFVELKAPGKHERPRQRIVQEALRYLGFIVYSSVDSKEKVDRILASLLTRQMTPESYTAAGDDANEV